MGDHLIVMHAAVRALPGYNRHDAPVILMDGPSISRETEQGLAVTAQLTRPHGTLDEALYAGIYALSTAHIPKGIRRQAREACEDYFYNRLGLEPDRVLDLQAPLPPSLELLPDPIYKALEDLVELVVDGKYADLSELSGEAELDVDDLRRRVEDDCPEAFVLPPREHYVVEAISKSDDPGDPGWAYFLDLWTENNGPARLHLEGELHPSQDRFNVTLADILP
jgi:hypothetical protein